MNMMHRISNIRSLLCNFSLVCGDNIFDSAAGLCWLEHYLTGCVYLFNRYECKVYL